MDNINDAIKLGLMNNNMINGIAITPAPGVGTYFSFRF